MLSDTDCQELLRQFPLVEGAFAYGSGAIEQSGYDYKRKSSSLPMVDLVFIVEDPYKWHQQNLIINPDHYTPPFPLFSPIIAFIEENVGAGIWYNTFIPMNVKSFPDRQMKYGVISMRQFKFDLTHWAYLYISGRLHKPVHMIKSSKLIDSMIEINRNYAFRTALLLLPKLFNEYDLYVRIASISYLGDFRMTVGGENPRKVYNLVTPIIPIYREIYKNQLNELKSIVDLKVISNLDNITMYSQVIHSFIHSMLFIYIYSYLLTFINRILIQLYDGKYVKIYH